MKQWSILVGLIMIPVAAGAATVAHWNFEPVPGYPANVAYDWSNNGWFLEIGPSGQIANDGQFGSNCLKNIGGTGAAPGSVAKVTNNYFRPAETVKGSALESVWAGAGWTIEMFVRFDAQPTTTPAHIFYIGNTQLDFNAGFKDVMGIYWQLTDGSIHYLQQRSGLVQNSYNHSRASSVVDQTPLTDGGWHHLTHSLRSGRDYIFFDGIIIDSDPFGGDSSDGYEASGNPMLAVLTSVQTVEAALGQPLVGSVDEIRISDEGLYNGSFNPPDQPFPTPEPIPPTATFTPTPTPTPTPPAPTPNPADIIAAWDFDVAPGSTIVPDRSGNGFDLTVNSTGEIVADGKFGGALHSTAITGDKPANRLNIDNTLLETVWTQTQWTVEGWWWFDGPNNAGNDPWVTLFSVGQTATNASWDQDNISICARETSQGNAASNPIDGTEFPTNGARLYQAAAFDALNAGSVWRHVAMTRSGNEYAFYLQGELKTRQTDTGTGPNGFDNNPQLCLLAATFNTAEMWAVLSRCDEVRICKSVYYAADSFTVPASWAGPPVNISKYWTFLE